MARRIAKVKVLFARNVLADFHIAAAKITKKLASQPAFRYSINSQSSVFHSFADNHIVGLESGLALQTALLHCAVVLFVPLCALLK